MNLKNISKYLLEILNEITVRHIPKMGIMTDTNKLNIEYKLEKKNALLQYTKLPDKSETDTATVHFIYIYNLFVHKII